MKLADIKVGEEYGAVDHPTGRYEILPRRVKVLEVVTVPKQTYNRYTYGVGTKNVRLLKVEFLDGDAGRSGYRWDAIARASKGLTMTVEARKIVGKWSDLAPDILAKQVTAQMKEEFRLIIEKRFEVLLGEDAPYVHIGPEIEDKPGQFSWHVRLENYEGERLLVLAEIGAAS